MTEVTKFEQSLDRLFKILQKVLEVREKYVLNLTGSNPTLLCLNKYIKAYEYDSTKYGKEGIKSHINYFEKIYNTHRESVLTGYKNDNWLKNGQIIIQFGEETNGIGISNVKILLSTIYNEACDIRTRAEEKLVGLSDEEYQKCQEIIYPEIILLHLYRIFVYILEQKSNSTDLIKLRNCLRDLEVELKIPTASAQAAPSTTPVAPTAPSENSLGGLGGLMNMATQFMQKIGMNVEGIQLPSENDITNVLGNIFNNPQIVQTVGNLARDASNNPEQLIPKLLNGFGIDNSNQLLTTIGNTALAAVDQTLPPQIPPITPGQPNDEVEFE